MSPGLIQLLHELIGHEAEVFRVADERVNFGIDSSASEWKKSI
jgi:hypothetical protein